MFRFNKLYGKVLPSVEVAAKSSEFRWVWISGFWLEAQGPRDSGFSSARFRRSRLKVLDLKAVKMSYQSMYQDLMGRMRMMGFFRVQSSVQNA